MTSASARAVTVWLCAVPAEPLVCLVSILHGPRARTLLDGERWQDGNKHLRTLAMDSLADSSALSRMMRPELRSCGLSFSLHTFLAL